MSMKMQNLVEKMVNYRLKCDGNNSNEYNYSRHMAVVLNKKYEIRGLWNKSCES